MDTNPGDPFPPGDPLGDTPLFREIQRVLLSSPGPINWELARQVAIATASWGADDAAPTPEDTKGLADTVRAAELAVAEFTGLPSPGDLPDVQAVRRGQWVEANIRGLRELLEPVAVKLGGAMNEAGGMAGTGASGVPFGLPLPEDSGSGESGSQAEMAAMLFQRMAPLLLGAQFGAVLGYLAQRVLGQYDLALPRSSGSLLFVVPNIAKVEHDWSLPPVEFRAWVTLHEVTHRFEFSPPWVRPHFIGLVKDLVEHAEVDFSGMERGFEDVDFSNPEALSQAFEGAGNFFGESSDPEQRLRIARVQAFMAAAEGYGDHVMEAVGRKMLGSYARIEEAMVRFREGRAGEEAMERLFGLEMKRQQYLSGRMFCARVAELTDEATLGRMWESPESLPSMPEIEEPTLWLARMA
jgi:putative hydrolase